MMNTTVEIDPVTGRIRIQVVEELQRVLGGDPVTETMIVRFIADRYGARSLCFLAPKVAEEILRRPSDFIRAAKQHCEPQLSF
jgi:hypothetical protein